MAQGLPLVRVGTLVATPLNSVVVLADGPVRTIADLKGRKIGFSVGGFEDALLGAMLERNGLTPRATSSWSTSTSRSRRPCWPARSTR